MNKTPQYIKLKELCFVNQGLQIPISKRHRQPGNNRYFYITVQFLKEGHLEKHYIANPPKSTICYPEDIIIVRTGSTGQVLTGITGCFHNNFFKVNYNKKLINGRYLYYCLTSKAKQREMKIRAGITTIPDLNHFMFLDMKIPHLPINSQIGIANTLDSIGQKIELNNQINKELEAIAKLIYDYWFVQFDFPISAEQAKAMGKPELEGKPYKASGGKMVYNEELKREIPEGWQLKQLGEYAEVKKGTLVTEKTADLSGDYKVVSGGINYSYKHNTFNRKKNTITISASGANAGFVNFWREPIFANDCTTVRGENDSITFLLLEFLRMRQEYITQQARGSAQPHVYPKDISSLKIEMPPSHLIKAYGKIVSPQNEKISNNLIENQKLSELRDWLLPMLMNGQVTIKDAEKYVNESELNMAAEKNEGYGE